MGKKKSVVDGPLSSLRETDEPLVKIPKSFQETVEIKRVAKNGIFQVADKKYSKTYELQDINYKIMSEEKQEDLIFGNYSELLNSMSCPFKFSIINTPKDMALIKTTMFIKQKDDGLDKFRKILNENINEKMYAGSKGIETRKYITLTGSFSTYRDATDGFKVYEGNLIKGLSQLKSNAKSLNAEERLRLLRDIYKIGENDTSEINLNELIKNNDSFKNSITNAKGIAYDPEGSYLRIGDKWGQALYASKFPAVMVDTFLVDLVNRPICCIASVDAVPVPKEITTTLLDRNYMGIEHDISEQQDKHNKQNAFASDISYKKRKEKAEIEEYMTDVSENDQLQFLTSIIVVAIADDKNMLDAAVASITAYGIGRGVRFDKCYLKQREAFNTSLPIGCMQVDYMRSMLTRNVAGLVPFNIMELSSEGNAICYGFNQLSHNGVFGNRKKLINGNGFYVGEPGSGKSFDGKLESVSVHLGSDDRVIVIDPTNEYVDIAVNFGGSAVVIDRKSEYYINPLDIDFSTYENDKLMEEVKGDKSELMTSFCSIIVESEFTGRHKSIVERAVRNLYDEIAALPHEEQYIPILSNFKKTLENMPEKEAKDIALSLERFTDGTFNVFNHLTNVDITSKYLVFAIRDLGKELFSVAMLIILTHIDKLVLDNYTKGYATWLYIDEIHEFFKNELTAECLHKYWKKHRKLGGIDTGLTQNVQDMLNSYTGRTMLSNSEFFYLLKQQSDADAIDLCANIGGMTDELITYVLNAVPGTGVLKHGRIVLPVDNQFEKDNLIYDMFNTDYHEKNQKVVN